MAYGFSIVNTFSQRILNTFLSSLYLVLRQVKFPNISTINGIQDMVRSFQGGVPKCRNEKTNHTWYA